MSSHVFIRESIDVVIYEVGIGGAWDSTNIIEHPRVTGITTLGIDHVSTLGDMVEKISWHKAPSPAFSVEQAPEAAQILEDRAAEKEVCLNFVKSNPTMSKIK